MDEMRLLIDLHRPAQRQGPGDNAHTLRAIELSGLAQRQQLKVADIGCGTGASTLVLAQALDADLTALDFLPEFLTELRQRAEQAGLGGRITCRASSMDALDFAPNSLDAIWSEGAIYNIGFENGVRTWHQYLKPGGVLAVSELTWLSAERPAELHAYWHAQYPEVGTAAQKIAVLERHGYSPLGYFVLDDACWLDAYYRPMQQRFAAFLHQHDHSEAARAIVAQEESEIALYEKYRSFFSYGFYIARKNVAISA